MVVKPTEVLSILTRTGGYLADVCSHTLQPYRGCALGNSLCGVGCYVRHNIWITKGQPWGSFVEPRINAAAIYRKQFAAEQKWARRERKQFSIFLSSSTEPFQPAETKYRVTAAVLRAMCELPPDELIVQTHSHHVLDVKETLCELKNLCHLRVHISLETDRDELPGLPKSASSVERRFAAGRALKDKGIHVVATVSPLLPIHDPHLFFRRIGDCFDAVVIDHFIGGDGTADGTRTRRTPLPLAMQQVDPASVTLEYRDRMLHIAKLHINRVGVGADGFGGRYLLDTTPMAMTSTSKAVTGCHNA